MAANGLPILVVGGGIGGLATAYALAHKGFPVRVLEQAPEFREVGAGIQLGPNSWRALRELGVEALVQAADLVVSGRATETTQDETRATYEGWVREAESHINWASHVDFVYDLIRGCNPAPGAWTMLGEHKLYLFDARKITAPTFGAVRGHKIGEVVSVGDAGMRILAQWGFVEVSRVRLDDGPKIKSTEAEIAEGTVLGG